MNSKKHRAAIVAITITALAFALAGVGRAAAVTFSLLADTATAIPGGTGSFTAFTPDPLLPPNPCISLGNVGFFGAGAGGQMGVYVMFPPGPPQKFADLNTLIPDGTGMFTSFFPQLTNSGSTLAVLASGAGQQGIYMLPPGPPTKVADLNTAIPNGTGMFTALPPGPPAISGSNVVFLGEGAAGQMGVYVAIPPGPPTKVADLNTAIPDGTGMFTALPPGPPSISGSNVVFLGEGAAGQMGVYVALPPGPPIKVADTNTAIPDAFGFFRFFTGVTIEGTAVAFVGGVPGTPASGPGVEGVYVAIPPGPPNKVADTGTAVPGGIGNFLFFGNVAIDPQNVVFEGFSDDGLGVNTIKGLYTNITGTLTKIIAVNDIVGGKTVSDLNFGPGGFSGDQVVFAATFTDGSQGITLATFSGARCPHSQGFWKNNPGLWPVTSLTLGNQSYTQTEVLTLMGTSTTSDASLILARQLIAAKLNVANGSDPAPVASTISDADVRLSGFTGKLPYNVKSSSPAGRAMTNDANVLSNYNTGLLTPNCTP